MSSLYLGIDLGTSGIRSAIIDDKEELLSLTSAPTAPTVIKDGNPEQDPLLWWEGVISSIKAHQEPLRKLGRSLSEVVALSVDGTSGTSLIADASLQPLTNGLMYHAKQFKEVWPIILKKTPEDSIVRSSTSGLARLLYLQNQITPKQPSFSKSNFFFFSQSDWILSRFLQEPQTNNSYPADENNVLKWGYDLDSEDWPTWYPDTGITIKALPKVYRVGTDIGNIAPRLAKELGLSPNLICVAGTTDSTAAFLASGARKIGEAVTSLGTTLSIKLINTHNLSDVDKGVYSHRVGDFWLVGGASNTGGGALLNYFNPTTMESLSKKINPSQPTNLNYYPLTSPGERFPINDAGFKGNLTPRPVEDTIFFQGMLEGIARVEKMGYDAIKNSGGVTVNTIFTAGGGAKNKVWTTIRENILNVPLKEIKHEQAAYGTALLASGKFN